MKTIIALFIAVLLYPTLNGSNLHQYQIRFSDKKNSPYSVNRPKEFLSERAVNRRIRQGIPITESDLPVNPVYLSALKQLNVKILHTGRWFNSATVICSSEGAQEIKGLPFVKSIEYVGKYFTKRLTLEHKKSKIPKTKKVFDNLYGFAETQTTILNGHKLHELGFWGEGMMIAVLDAGFYNANRTPFLEKLRADGRLLGVKDYVNEEEFPFQSSTHGTKVLSVMAANIPGLMVGTAPNATFICIKTEDSRGEFRFEECNWVAGLEYADSLGADIVNSSLGYTYFEDSNMNYSPDRLDGKTALCSQAAVIAAQKGIIIVNSAGNEGSSDWKRVAPPADAPNILAIGAINHWGQKTDFSSVGPTVQGNTKPDLVALGENVAVASPFKGYVVSGQGTSYAAPIICGLTAALWQAFPEKTNVEIMDAVKLTARDSANPNNKTGYGIPDFYRAFEYLKSLE